MSAASQFGGGLPFGAYVRGRDLPSPQYERLDGRTKVRADNARLSAKFPIGKMTGTSRTLATSATANAPCIVAGTNFVAAAGSNTTNAIQYSADNGVTWNTVTTLTCTVAGLVATPTRIVALSSGANVPMATASLNPATTWSATTGGGSLVSTNNVSSYCRLCYCTAGPGKVIAVHPTAGVYTMDEGSTAWVSRSSSARTGVAWSGTNAVGITAGSATASISTDGGLTWADFTLPEALSSNQGNIASNGAGTIGISGSPSGLQVSYDHGVSWQIVQIPTIPPSDTLRIQYSGGYFMVPTAKGLAMSADLRSWQIDPAPLQLFGTAIAVARRGSTILQTQNTSSAAATLLESSTEYRLPDVQEFVPSISGVPTPLDPTFIKAL